ncbi:MAG: hypothetical protein IJ933_02965 [Bacteroidales bacterium]|nr:hypothetical protein [Bacteroidales bacterium]
MKGNHRIFKILIVILVTIGVSLALQMLLADDAMARPGGGHGFRGGGGYRGGGSHVRAAVAVSSYISLEVLATTSSSTSLYG